MNHPLIRPRVYVAGPISIGDSKENVRRAIEVGLRLRELGYAPIIPHLTHFIDPQGLAGTHSYDEWLDCDMSYIATSDAVLRIPGESSGADREVAFAQEIGVPVYHAIEEVQQRVPYKGDSRFHTLLSSLGRLHDEKQADYGQEGDPFANVRSAKEWSVPPWVGAMIRLSDKVRRLQRFAQRGTLVNEGAKDSLQDIAVYALIALILLQEEGA